MRKHRAEHLLRAVLHSTNKITRSSSAAFGGTFPTKEGKKGVNKRAVLYKWDSALASPPGAQSAGSVVKEDPVGIRIRT